MFKIEEVRLGADLTDTDLSYFDLAGTNFVGADLRGSNLKGCNLRGSDLYAATLRWVNLSRAILTDANLRGADLRFSDLTDADLSGADLTGADLRDAILTNAKGLPPMICPEKGSYVGYKKARCLENCCISVIVTLEIPERAKRSSATSDKCRCSEAKVVSIESLDGTKKYERATSSYCRSFVYEVGKTVRVDDFDDDRWAECARGIHHFMSRKEAEEYLI